jgi:hypothetical protein
MPIDENSMSSVSIQPFHTWCITTHAEGELQNTIVGVWIDNILKDESMPWDGTCQEIYEYLKGNLTEVEAYLCAWEMSGRVVEIDDDYSSETFDEEESNSYVSGIDSESISEASNTSN